MSKPLPFSVHTVDMVRDSESAAIAYFENYEQAVAFADAIKTAPVYGRPVYDGVYVVIYDDDHDSPRYTSW